MMDELELLKKDWQKREADLPKLSYDEIHTMLWKKSSSVVRWILTISILELTLPQLLFVFPSFRKSISVLNGFTFDFGDIALTIIYYVGVLCFIYLFYKSYKEISVLDNAKNLMRKIIRTRKTVFYYIIFSLVMFFLFFLYYAFEMYFYDDALLNIKGIEQLLEKKSLEEIRSLVFWVFLGGGLIFTVLIGGVYFLLYGFLIRKLHRNYRELKRLEI